MQDSLSVQLQRNIILNASIFQFVNYEFLFKIAIDEKDDMIWYVIIKNNPRENLIILGLEGGS